MIGDPRIALLLRHFQGGGVPMGMEGGPSQRAGVAGGPVDYLRPGQMAPRQMPQAQAPTPPPPSPANPVMGGLGMLSQALMRAPRAAPTPSWRDISPAAMEGVIEDLPGADAKAYLQGLAPDSFWQRLGLSGLFGGF